MSRSSPAVDTDGPTRVQAIAQRAETDPRQTRLPWYNDPDVDPVEMVTGADYHPEDAPAHANGGQSGAGD